MTRRVLSGTLYGTLKMPLNLEQFLERVADLTDPSELCELLGITSEDILERFSDVVEEKSGVLREIFDIDVYIDDEEGGDDEFNN